MGRKRITNPVFGLGGQVAGGRLQSCPVITRDPPSVLHGRTSSPFCAGSSLQPTDCSNRWESVPSRMTKARTTSSGQHSSWLSAILRWVSLVSNWWMEIHTSGSWRCTRITGGRVSDSALVEGTCDWARSGHFGAITLTTFRDVPWNGPFYESLGFVAMDTLTPELSAIREHERSIGDDDFGPRVAMRLPL